MKYELVFYGKDNRIFSIYEATRRRVKDSKITFLDPKLILFNCRFVSENYHLFINGERIYFRTCLYTKNKIYIWKISKLSWEIEYSDKCDILRRKLCVDFE